MSIKWEKLLICIAIPLAVGTIAGLIIKESIPLYSAMPKPALAPPPWIFPIVWTILYTLMGVSSYLISMSVSKDTIKALLIYALQLAVNFIWPIVFFNLQSYLPALIILIILWILVFIMIRKFTDINPLAGNLQIPYLIWLTFALYLNISVVLLN